MDMPQLLEDPAVAAILPRVLARVAAADRVVHAEEARVLLPYFKEFDADQLAEALTHDPPAPFAPGSLAASLPDPEHRSRVLQLAVKMAWMDRQVHDAEVSALLEIAAALGEPATEVRRMLSEVIAGPGRCPDLDQVRAAVRATAWEDLVVDEGPPMSNLQRVLPEGEVVVAVVRAGPVEQVVITGRGLAAGFAEGDAFIAWGDIRMFTRQSTLAAAVKIDTRDFRMRTVADVRLAPVANFLDHAMAGTLP